MYSQQWISCKWYNDYAIYLLSKEERKEMYEFIDKQLRKEYIMPSKSPQMALVFFVKKRMF